MKAAFFRRHGGPEVLEYGELPDPVPGPGEVLVDVHAASVNAADWKMRAGSYAAAPRLPHVPGRDFSGVVAAGGADLKAGEAVFGVCEVNREGAYAEKIAIGAAIVARKPDALSHAECAALALTGLTALVSVPTLLTVFTVTASLELDGRMRGGTGLLGWVRALPWGNPMTLATGLAFVMLFFGGGGGLINMSYGMNAMIHNTAWVQGHFHLTVGTATALTYMGTAYWLLPRLTGRPLRLAPLAQVQPYLWFFGMMVFSLVNHATGLAGMPRRIYDSTYQGHPVAQVCQQWTGLSALGGAVLFVSSLAFLAVVVASAVGPRRGAAAPIAYAESLDQGGNRVGPASFGIDDDPQLRPSLLQPAHHVVADVSICQQDQVAQAVQRAQPGKGGRFPDAQAAEP